MANEDAMEEDHEQMLQLGENQLSPEPPFDMNRMENDDALDNYFNQLLQLDENQLSPEPPSLHVEMEPDLEEKTNQELRDDIEQEQKQRVAAAVEAFKGATTGKL